MKTQALARARASQGPGSPPHLSVTSVLLKLSLARILLALSGALTPVQSLFSGELLFGRSLWALGGDLYHWILFLVGYVSAPVRTPFLKLGKVFIRTDVRRWHFLAGKRRECGSPGTAGEGPRTGRASCRPAPGPGASPAEALFGGMPRRTGLCLRFFVVVPAGVRAGSPGCSAASRGWLWSMGVAGPLWRGDAAGWLGPPHPAGARQLGRSHPGQAPLPALFILSAGPCPCLAHACSRVILIHTGLDHFPSRRSCRPSQHLPLSPILTPLSPIHPPSSNSTHTHTHTRTQRHAWHTAASAPRSGG